jgi:hypothetical protein
MSTRTISLPDEQAILDVLRATSGTTSVYFGHMPGGVVEWHARWHGLFRTAPAGRSG